MKKFVKFAAGAAALAGAVLWCIVFPAEGFRGRHIQEGY